MTKKKEYDLICGTDPQTLRAMYESDPLKYKTVTRKLAPLRRSAMNRLMIRVRVDEQGNWIDKKRNATWGEKGPKMRDRQMEFVGGPEYVHRVAWRLFRGEIPDGHVLMREKGREWSVCPSHLECQPRSEAMVELSERRKAARNG